MTKTSKIFDYHVHTQYAYCSQNDMLPESTIKIARDKGYGICLIEHAGQLYVNNNDYWSANYMYKPELRFKEETNRMDEFIAYVSQFRSEDVKIGLELDFDDNGEVTLRDEHADSFDLFLGAIHNIPNRFNDFDKGFLWSMDVFFDFKVNILAHPFRIYRQKKLPRPVHLYEKVAKTLHKNNIAAELGFHINEPDKRFFKICIENGVKIALSSDAHKMSEVCSFEQNIEFLNEINNGNIDDILYNIDDRVQI